MSWYDYEQSKKINALDPPFYSLLMSAIRKADTANTAKLRSAWPDLWDEFAARYDAPGGYLPGEDPHRPDPSWTPECGPELVNFKGGGRVHSDLSWTPGVDQGLD